MISASKLELQAEQVWQSRTAGRMQRILQSKMGLWLIAAISFFESALPVPLITDPFMVAAILANRNRTTLLVAVTTISSLLGGLAAFAMAAFFFDVILQYMSPAIQQEFQHLIRFGNSDTLVTTITGAITPVPYTVTAWVIAVAGGSVWVFLLGSIFGRALRYAIVGYCTYRFGPAALRYARRSLAVTSIIVLIAVGLYLWLKL